MQAYPSRGEQESYQQKATNKQYCFSNASVVTEVLFVILFHPEQNTHFHPLVTLCDKHTLTQRKSQ